LRRQSINDRLRVEVVHLLQGLIELLDSAADFGHVLLQTNADNEHLRCRVQHLIKLLRRDANALRTGSRPGFGLDACRCNRFIRRRQVISRALCDRL